MIINVSENLSREILKAGVNDFIEIQRNQAWVMRLCDGFNRNFNIFRERKDDIITQTEE